MAATAIKKNCMVVVWVIFMPSVCLSVRPDYIFFTNGRVRQEGGMIQAN